MSFSHTDDGTSEAAWAEGGVGELPELRLPCLLYTSDAADE